MIDPANFKNPDISKKSEDDFSILIPGLKFWDNIQPSFISNKNNYSRIKRANYRAVKNWLTKYKFNHHKSSNLEKIQGYLEAFHHLSAAEDWDNLKKLSSLSLSPALDENLDNQLGNWSYFQKQIELYSVLLDKVEPSFQIICLQGLGNAYHALGNRESAIQYNQRSITLCQSTKNRKSEGKSTELSAAESGN